MKIRNLFESTIVVDYGVTAVNYTGLLPTPRKIEGLAGQLIVDASLKGWIYYYVVVCAKFSVLNRASLKTDMPSYVYCFHVENPGILREVVRTVAVHNFYHKLFLFFEDLNTIIASNEALAPDSKADANTLYKHLLDNESFGEGEHNTRTLDDVAYDFKDDAVELADTLSDIGFTNEQIWGQYSVAKFQQVFLSFVRNYIKTRVK